MMATNLPTTSSYGPGAEWPLLALTLPATDALAVPLSLPLALPTSLPTSAAHHPLVPSLAALLHSGYYDYPQRPVYYPGLAPYVLMGMFGFGTQDMLFAAVAKPEGHDQAHAHVNVNVHHGSGVGSGVGNGVGSAPGSAMAPPAPSTSASSLPLPSHHHPSYSPAASWPPMTPLAPPVQQRPQHIDYSSLVLFTVLPLLKRKRRRNDSDPASEAGSGDSQFPCPVCNKAFQKPYNLKLHMKTHSPDKPYKCLKCPKTFARCHDKRRHELLHDGVKNFTCQGYLNDGVTKWGCGKKFARLDALARHFRTETGWMCILPLMDEAKRSREGAVDDHTMIKRIIAER